jgi:uncharacterized membrane protein YedE/YeeE
MSIDWAHFTPATALLGGALIGASAGLMALVGGKIAGVAGIFGTTLNEALQGKRTQSWRLYFLGGIVVASLAWSLLRPIPGVDIGQSGLIVALGGLLVGFGARLGSGCPSGHGVCGLARVSSRSMAAVLTFMTTGMMTTFVLRHLLSWG